MKSTWEDPTKSYSTDTTNVPFDLIEYQDKARDIYSPRRLFELWEDVCKKYDQGFIGSYALDEMKCVIWPKLHSLSHCRFFTS
jgi:hypothetical protein